MLLLLAFLFLLVVIFLLSMLINEGKRDILQAHRQAQVNRNWQAFKKF